MESDQKLPDEVHVTRFACARAREMSALTQCLKKPANTRLLFQSLPRHMRRRVMSHDNRRLPRRLRNNIAKSEDSTPSRRRTRTKRLTLLQFKRRQCSFSWLETHIWHAKRFHMTKKWGFNLPERPCDKAFRACYRASSAHALLQDISYFKCVQLRGAIPEMREGFKRITNPNCGPGIAAIRYLNGEREGETYVFGVDKYPFGCIGKISFIWTSQNESDGRVRLFVHPSFYSEFIDTIVQCFSLIKTETESEPDEIRFKNKTSIELIESSELLNRFRLTGPLSNAILQNVMKPVNLQLENWLSKSILSNEELKNSHYAQILFWHKIRNLFSPAELQSKLVLALNVKDPRINYPQKRTKAIPSMEECPAISDLLNIPAGLNRSLLWNDEIGQTIVTNKISNIKINEIRQKTCLVPGECNDLLENIPGVPVILIQQPGNGNSLFKKIGYNCGWDVLIPAGYGMPFWISFILRGARTGGTREFSNLLFESGKCDLEPDTMACKNEDVKMQTMMTDKYFKRPPNKRVNFAKLSINSPFICRWNVLINDWSDSQNVDDIYVLRERNLLRELQRMISFGIYESDFSWNPKCLVPVKLSLKSKGKLSNFALICFPVENDSPILPSDKLVEPLKTDNNQIIRKVLRAKHKKTLKILRRKSIRRKRRILEKSEKMIFVPKQDNSVINNIYINKMRDLWLPKDITNVRHQCTRETIGYVVKGDFSFTEARSVGIGFVTLKSIQKLLQSGLIEKKLVLVRNTLSRQYRYATMDIIIDMLT